jgi:polysaccharide biosynthesis transport protein
MEHNNNNFPPQPETRDLSSVGPGMGIADILWTLRRRWLWPVFGCLIGLTLAFCYVASVPTPYKSSARILLDRSLNRYLQTNKILDEPTFDEAEIGSQVYLLSSDGVVVPVVRSMNLTHDSEFVGPSKEGSARVWGYIDGLKKFVEQSIGWNTVAPIDPNTALERSVIDAILRRLTVYREDVANVISVSFESEDPNKAARIANAIADSYIATTLDSKIKATKMVSQWLQDRLTELRTQALDADRALQDYKIANNLIATGKGNLPNSEALNTLDTQLSNARIAVAEAKARLDRIQRMGAESIMNVIAADVGSNPEVARSGRLNWALTNAEILRLRTQYRELTSRAAEIESIVGPNHSAVLKLRDRIDDLHKSIQEEEQRIADAYANEYQMAAVRESELAASKSQSIGEAETTTQAQITMRELESSADALRTLYNSFLQKFKEINTLQTQTIPIQSARILTRAAPPLYKSYKKPTAILAGGMMLGFLLGAGAVVGREWLAGVFRTPRAVEQITELPCVVLPMVQAGRERPSWSFGGARQTPTEAPIEEFALDAPYSRFTETLRNLKALVNTAQIAGGATVIGIVSSVSKEGKTTVAANLAALITKSSGANTLIIDADLHLRSLTGRLAPGAREGLIEALDDPSRLASVVTRRPRSGLDVLPCAAADRIPNAAELLGSPKMEQLLLAARKAYDYILIEIPPIISVVDLKMIERFIDCFIFVVEWGQTKQSLVVEALSEAAMIRERLVGVVLNKADPSALRSMESYKGDRYTDYYQE